MSLEWERPQDKSTAPDNQKKEGGKHKGIIDTFILKKVKRPKLSYYKNSSRIKIKINKKRRLLKFAIRFLVPLTLACFAVLFLWQSTPARIYWLISSLKNENILIGFQNSAELRPTGGFWGSFALLEVRKNIGDSNLLFETNPYKRDNPLLNELKVELPKPMKETWEDRPQSFVNANWDIDFPEAAKTLEWYFGQGWDKPVSGTVAISSLAMIDLLKLIGPIEAPDGTEISADNFTQIMSQKIDTDYWQNPENIKINEPKTIIKEIAPQVIEKTKKLPLTTLYSYLKDQMRYGRILAYFNDTPRQNQIQKLGISGKLSPYKVDYLSINNANLNGGKSSLNIIQSINYHVFVQDEKAVAQVQITRFQKPLWPNIVNRNYTRVVVPLGSRLISAVQDNSNILPQVETNDEFGKTSFGFWFSVGPNESKTTILTYELPFDQKLLKNYNLVLQKQPGTNPDHLEITVNQDTIFYGENRLNELILTKT